MDEPEGRWIATGLLELVEHPADVLVELVRRCVREDAIRRASRAAEGRFGTTAEEDRNTGSMASDTHREESGS